jgi:hypothetical protein
MTNLLRSNHYMSSNDFTTTNDWPLEVFQERVLRGLTDGQSKSIETPTTITERTAKKVPKIRMNINHSTLTCDNMLSCRIVLYCRDMQEALLESGYKERSDEDA